MPSPRAQKMRAPAKRALRIAPAMIELCTDLTPSPPQWKHLQRIAQRFSIVWPLLSRTPMTITIQLTSNAAIAQLNAKYRRKNTPTDVLSFAYTSSDGGHIGDIVIGVERALQQAKTRALQPVEEYVRLIIHGLAHLAGFDHHTQRDFAAMREREIAALAMIYAGRRDV